MDIERRSPFAVRPTPADPVDADAVVDQGIRQRAWTTDACAGPATGMLPETADLEGQPERRLIVDDYSSQVLGEHHPAGGPLEG
jgi:hypothetical protein